VSATAAPEEIAPAAESPGDDEQAPRHVFISYSRTDADFVGRLRVALDERG
jgi:hypothetical protein